jgi:hypothetical protein
MEKETRMPRSVFAAVALCSLLVPTFFVATAGAAIPKATPTPLILTTPTPAPTVPPIRPSVIVYPFDIGSDMPKGASQQIATIFDQQLAAAGGIVVITPSAGIVRAQYLTSAAANHADYYISGFLTAVGDSAALTTQLVSVRTGIMLRSTTVSISSASDAAAQALAARDLMFADSGVTQADISTGGNATPTPSSDNGASVSLNNAGGFLGLFHHGKAAAATPGPAVKPARVAVVARVDGNVDPSALTVATNHLNAALSRSFTTREGSVDSKNVAAQANAVCGNHRDATIVAGSIVHTPRRGFHHESDTFHLTVYTCFGAPLYAGSGDGNSVDGAIDAAVHDYVAGHPLNS